MCVIALALFPDARWPIVLVGNRDERHDRPSAALAHWADAPTVIGGRDLAAGGTWLGVSEAGRLATVTNVRTGGAPDPARPSRGRLVRELLTGEGEFADLDRLDLAAFNPLNLIFVEGAAGVFCSNSPASARVPLTSGVHGLGNRGELDEPSERVRRLKDGLAAWVEDEAHDIEPLFALLADDRPNTDGSSPMFIRNPAYGTRASTVVRIGRDGQGGIVERRFNADGAFAGQDGLGFSWPAGKE